MHRWDPLHPLRSSARNRHNPSTLEPSSSSPQSPAAPKDTTKPTKRVRFADDYTPSSLKLKIVCGPRHDPSLVIYIKLKFDSGGGRPRLGFKIRRPREDEKDEEDERSEGPESKDEVENNKRKVGESEWMAGGSHRISGSGGGSGQTERHKDRGEARNSERGRELEREKRRYTTEERWPGAENGNSKERVVEKGEVASNEEDGLSERERRRY